MSPFLSRVKSGNRLDDSTTPGQVTKRLESPVLSKKTTLENQSKYSHLFKLSHMFGILILYGKQCCIVLLSIQYTKYDYFSLWLTFLACHFSNERQENAFSVLTWECPQESSVPREQRTVQPHFCLIDSTDQTDIATVHQQRVVWRQSPHDEIRISCVWLDQVTYYVLSTVR